MAKAAYLVLAFALLCAVDGRAALRSAHVHDHSGRDKDATALRMNATLLETVARQLMKQHSTNFPKHKETISKKLREVDLRATVDRLTQKVPTDVATLLRVSVEGKAKQPFPEESLAKALSVLNELLFKALNELDDVVIECKTFEDKNRGTFDQVMTDIARLGETIADLERQSAEAQENINAKEAEIQSVIAQLKKETDIYKKILFEDKREMAIRQGDLAVFQFMMELTKCEETTSLVQLDKPAMAPNVKVCETNHGFELNFEDAAKQQKLERMMTPRARKAVQEILQRVKATEAKAAAQLLQQSLEAKGPKGNKRTGKADDDSDDIDDDVDDADTKTDREHVTALSSLGVKANSTEDPERTNDPEELLPELAPPVEKTEVVKTVDVSQGWKKCTQGPPDCGLLHDNMSIMWGKFKDLVDELQMKMDKEKFEFEELVANMNEQLDVLRNSKARFIMELNEATANLNSAREEASEKEQERFELEHEFNIKMKSCKKRMDWIKFQDYCAFLSVRVTTMEYSSVSPPEKIVDCALTDWVPGECSVSCDDSCPDETNPYGCGGWQTLTRDVIVKNNEFGYECSVLERKRKCKQIKCPVDCVQSEWSLYSACTREECGGGTKSRTRSILVKPKNGGMSCNTVVETVPCNTESCDRDCALAPWTEWSPCSVACGGGFMEKWRRVTVPIRGNGECPKPDSSWRHQMEVCNPHDCVGDEICIARQDLILAIDGSGSVQESGFGVLKDFALKLVDKYQGMYYGYADMKIGIILFGNGEIMDDGTISEATEILPLTNDMGEVKTAIEGLTHQKGFTNMAQAFSKAESMFVRGGRKVAQSAILTLTDGKPSFLFQAHQKVMELKDKHTKLFFMPVTEFEGEELQLMKSWASEPWQTHLVHVPGLEVLAADEEVFAQKALTQFCPHAISPSSMAVEEEEKGYFLVREDGLCGKQAGLLAINAQDPAECASLCAQKGFTSFSFGKVYASGHCFASDLEVTADLAKSFKENRANPSCPEGSGFSESVLYDFYALEPLGE